MGMALIVAGLVMLVALVSIYWQIRNLRGLRLPNIPSDERKYRRNQAILRFANGILLLGLAGMIGGAFLSGMENRADELGNRRAALGPGEQKPEITPEEKEFLKDYSFYWFTVLGLVFLVVSLAIVDFWATRKYAIAQLRRMQGEHRAILERDLAVYRQQKLNNRMKNAQP